MRRVRCWICRVLRDEAGMATVEAAYALAAISVVMLSCLGGLAAMTSAVRCVDAAREVARLTAAGDMRARMVGAAVAPSGARISVVVSGDDVRVRVEAGAPLLPMLTVSGTAVALMEPRDDEGSNASITSER
ncbi:MULTISPECIES: TadE family type IV pilus minor pilin [Gordonia]|uniref:TadE family type IV pilus minor pilin n=1 Tax=Gordonia TaxID=2053 RepID=UPI0031D6A9D2